MAVANPIPTAVLRKQFSTRSTREARARLIALNTGSRNHEADLQDARSVDIPTITVESNIGDQARGGDFPAPGRIRQTNQTMTVNDGKTTTVPIELEAIDDNNLPYVDTIRSRQRYDLEKEIEDDFWTYMDGLTFASDQVIELGSATVRLDPVTGKPVGTDAINLVRDGIREGQLYFQDNDILAPTGDSGPDTINPNEMPAIAGQPRVIKNLIDQQEDSGSPIARDFAARFGGVYASGAYRGEYRYGRLFSTSSIPKPTGSGNASTPWNIYMYTRDAFEMAVRPFKVWVREPEHTGGTNMELVQNVRWARLRVNALHIVRIRIRTAIA